MPSLLRKNWHNRGKSPELIAFWPPENGAKDIEGMVLSIRKMSLVEIAEYMSSNNEEIFNNLMKNITFGKN
ncbi:hypothetical protein [uncultured Microscilla sp.]|uniref:hypothetical protein n=1 Tax=uncultured Microscilla sp. TaxID=432653 RepID=UPI0026021C70|nr:hypothetical protein [uncultured Microscilla sp.]